jgi:hypothetical protein
MLQRYHADKGDFLHPNEGYRSLTGQETYYNDPDVQPKAVPGTSNHGCGVAVDFSFSGSQRSWVLDNGPTYGYFPLSGDEVHFNYFGSTATPPPVETPHPAASMVKMPNGTLAAASIDQYGSMFEANQTAPGAGFTAWTKLTNGGYVGKPAAIVAPNGTLAIFGRGTGGAIGLVAQSAPGSGFTNYGAIGSGAPTFGYDPAVALAPNNTLVVVAVSTDGRLWETHQTAVGGSFAAWTPISSGKVGTPAIVKATNNTMAVTARSTRNEIGIIAQQVQAGAYVDFGAVGVNGPAFASSPAMALAPNGTVIVAGVSTDGRLWVSNQTSVTSTFTAWSAIASGKMGTPAMLKASNDTMAITVRSSVGTISMVAQTVKAGAFVDLGSISTAGYFVSDPCMTLGADNTVGVIATDGTNNRFFARQSSPTSGFNPWTKL